MHNSTLSTLTASLLLTLCVGAWAAPLSKVDYQAGKASIQAQRKADKISCEAQTANAKDICEEEAKGRAHIALAELEASYAPSPKHSYEIGVARADANFDVAKEKCDDLAGAPKDVCRTEAKSAHSAALAEAKLSQKTVQNNRQEAQSIGAAKATAAEKNASAQNTAPTDIRQAQYQSAAEKCAAFAADVKAACIASAKAQYGQN